MSNKSDHSGSAEILAVFIILWCGWSGIFTAILLTYKFLMYIS